MAPSESNASTGEPVRSQLPLLDLSCGLQQHVSAPQTDSLRLTLPVGGNSRQGTAAIYDEYHGPEQHAATDSKGGIALSERLQLLFDEGRSEAPLPNEDDESQEDRRVNSLPVPISALRKPLWLRAPTCRQVGKYLAARVPIVSWLPLYTWASLRGDVVSAITVAVLLLPQGMAYALLAGLPPVFGLYSATVPPIMYSFFGSSRQLAVGPFALTTLLTGAALTRYPPSETLAVTFIISFLVGVFQLLFGICKLGFVVTFMSRPVISGFNSGAAIIIVLGQLSALTGITYPVPLDYPWQHIPALIKNASKISVGSSIMGVLCIIFMLLINALSTRIRKPIPGPIFVVCLGILFGWCLELDQKGMKLVGYVPPGLPPLTYPKFNDPGLDIPSLLLNCLVIAILGFLSAVSVARAFADKYQYTLDPNQELIALGMANIGGSFFSSHPVSAGLARSAVADQAGAKTPLFGLMTGALVGVFLLTVTSLLRFLPMCVLAAIIITASSQMIHIRVPMELWAMQKIDCFTCVLAIVATVGLDITLGLIVSIGISLFSVVLASAWPHTAELGRLGRSDTYRNTRRFPLAHTYPGLHIFRFDESLYFANCLYFRQQLERVVERQQQQQPALRCIVLEFSGVNRVDSTALGVLKEIIKAFAARNIIILYTEMKGAIRDQFLYAGIVHDNEKKNYFWKNHDAVLHYCRLYNVDPNVLLPSQNMRNESGALLLASRKRYHRSSDAASSNSLRADAQGPTQPLLSPPSPQQQQQQQHQQQQQQNQQQNQQQDE